MPDKKPDPTPAEQITALSDTLVKDDKGVWAVPEGTDEPDPVLFEAAKTQKRFKDTQAAYTQSSQKNAALTSTNEQMAQHLLDTTTAHITDVQRVELDDLKISDPDAWRDKINLYEEEARTLMGTKVKEFTTEGNKTSALHARQEAYKQFTDDFGLELTDEIIEKNLPASYSKDLADGSITFEQFLNKAKDFLTRDKVIAGAEDGDDNDSNIDLGDLPGGSKPSDKAQKEDETTSYENTVY